jgi:hypothetical protein
MRRRLLAVLVCAALVACGGDDGSPEQLCAALRADPSITNAFAGFDPTDTDTALEQLRHARVTLGDLREAAPSEVRGDLSVEIDYIQALLEGLEGVDGRDAGEAVDVVRQVTADHPEVGEAAARLSRYTDRSCR